MAAAGAPRGRIALVMPADRGRCLPGVYSADPLGETTVLMVEGTERYRGGITRTAGLTACAIARFCLCLRSASRSARMFAR